MTNFRQKTNGSCIFCDNENDEDSKNNNFFENEVKVNNVLAIYVDLHLSVNQCIDMRKHNIIMFNDSLYRQIHREVHFCCEDSSLVILKPQRIKY